MNKPLVPLGRDCENCGEPLLTRTPNNPSPKRFCSDNCRYEGWKKKNLQDLRELIEKLSKHGVAAL